MAEVSLSDVLPGRPPNRPSRRSEERERRRRAKRRRRRTAIVLLVAVLLVGGGVAASFAGLAPLVSQFFEPNDYEGAGTGTVEVEVADGDSGRQIARTLEGKGVVKTVKAFADLAATDSRGQGIQPGLYELRLEMSAAAALDWLADPDHRLLTRVTVPEGRRLSQILDQLAKALDLPREDFQAAVDDPTLISLPDAAKGEAEGYLYPSTYEFRPDVTAQDALKSMVARNVQVLTDLGVPREQFAEVMVKASIVQAEGRHAEDFGKIARVLDNRLAIDMPLQLDSTVSYAVGRFGVTTTKAERASTSPYNTYKYKGLPPGPISAPGQQAMEAVLNPTEGTWLYFVATDPETGETKFATTEAERVAITQEFQAWLRDHPQG